MRRDGALTEQSLSDALSTEMADGARPTRIAVGSLDLHQVAVRILQGSGAFATLCAVFPVVDVDPALEPDQWELRTAAPAGV